MPQVQVIQPIQQQPKRLRVAAYARVSSKSANQLNSMSVQVEYYTDLIQKNPDWEFAGVYADEGISGTGDLDLPHTPSMRSRLLHVTNPRRTHSTRISHHAQQANRKPRADFHPRPA